MYKIINITCALGLILRRNLQAPCVWDVWQNFDFNLKGIIQKISYERRDYESVDEKSYVPRNYKKKNPEGSNWLSRQINNVTQNIMKGHVQNSSE